MLKTNEKKLVEFLFECKPGVPYRGKSHFDKDGKYFNVPSIGGITLNVGAGDNAFGLAGDHIEPGVSCRAGDKPMEHPNNSFQYFCCAGNEAKIMSGNAKGAKGVVLGTHGGSEHVMIEFDRKTKEKMSYDDKIQVKVVGQGLELTDYPNVRVASLSPSLLKKMKIKEKNGKLQVPVTTLIPSELMGSGIGTLDVQTGDYDIMTSDPESIKKYNLDKIRFGDFVALMDQDNRYGRTHRKGAVTIGVVIHSDCYFAGHGPGVMILLSGVNGEIEPVISPKANMADYLKIGSAKPKRK